MSSGFGRFLRFVGLGRDWHVCDILRGNWGDRVERHAWFALIMLLMHRLPLLVFAPLKLLQSLHDGAIRNALLMLDRCNSTVAMVWHAIPVLACAVLVLG